MSKAPGYIEADTVAHCGLSMAGEFCWSLTLTDVHTQWTETRAVPNRGQSAIHSKIAEIEAELPFPILGFDAKLRAVLRREVRPALRRAA